MLNYTAVSMELNTKDEIYSAMVIYGLLTYGDGEVSIPNKELMDKCQELGEDITIMSALPQHKTDAIFRVENVDRYDDKDVIITNLFDTYDRLMEFGKKHLSDPFILEGINSVSARDKILREIFSNLLAHRDYSSAYVAKFVIEKQCMYTENANRARGYGMLELYSH